MALLYSLMCCLHQLSMLCFHKPLDLWCQARMFCHVGRMLPLSWVLLVLILWAQYGLLLLRPDLIGCVSPCCNLSGDFVDARVVG